MDDQKLNLGFSAPDEDVEHEAVATFAGYGAHGMRAETNHDEEARIDFVMELYRHLGQNVAPGRRDVYDARVLPAFTKEYGRRPENRHEIRKATRDDPFFQMWGHLRVTAQETFNYENGRTVNRQYEDLIERAEPEKNGEGSLELDPEFVVPKYQSTFDMHWMPGGYFTEHEDGDVAGGALYDLGGIYIITSGHLGPYNDGAAYSVVNYLREKFPDFTPSRVLDEGCTVGHNLLPFKEAWPNADVTGIDIGAPVLRYGHRRAQDMGYDVHFSQRNAEHTKYDDESFDFVVSTMFLHETSHKAVHNVVKECHRILKPGGLMLHVEQPPFTWFDDPFDQFVRDWDTHNNNEPFWGTMHDMDLEDVALRAGFAKNEIIQEMTPVIKPTETDRFARAAGEWYVFAAWKR